MFYCKCTNKKPKKQISDSFFYYLTVFNIFILKLSHSMKLIISENQLGQISKILKEDPDSAEVKDDRGYTINFTSFNDKDALAFGMKNNKMYVGYCPELTNKHIEHILNLPEYSHLLKNDLKTHDFMADFYDALFDESDTSMIRKTMDFPGRLWFNSKIISFWKYPSKNQLTGILIRLAKEIYRIYNYNVDFSDYRIEIRDKGQFRTEFIPVQQFIGGIDSSSEDMSKMHLLPSAEKNKTPQMQAAKKNNLNYLEIKFPEDTIQAQWNSAKNKYRGENTEFENLKLLKEDPNRVYDNYNDKCIAQ